MSEFERECEEYGCPPVTKQWGNVIDMLMAQTEPKNQKKEEKMWEKKWSQICIESGWDNPEKMSVALAPKLELWRIKFVKNYIRVEKTRIYYEIGFVGYLDIIQVADVVIQIVKMNY